MKRERERERERGGEGGERERERRGGGERERRERGGEGEWVRKWCEGGRGDHHFRTLLVDDFLFAEALAHDLIGRLTHDLQRVNMVLS